MADTLMREYIQKRLETWQTRLGETRLADNRIFVEQEVALCRLALRGIELEEACSPVADIYDAFKGEDVTFRCRDGEGLFFNITKALARTQEQEKKDA